MSKFYIWPIAVVGAVCVYNALLLIFGFLVVYVYVYRRSPFGFDIEGVIELLPQVMNTTGAYSLAGVVMALSAALAGYVCGKLAPEREIASAVAAWGLDRLLMFGIGYGAVTLVNIVLEVIALCFWVFGSVLYARRRI